MGNKLITRQEKGGFNSLSLAAADSQLPYHEQNWNDCLISVVHVRKNVSVLGRIGFLGAL
jgi:hypothetical protein